METKRNEILIYNTKRDLAVQLEAADTILQYIQENTTDSKITEGVKELQLFINRLINIIDKQTDVLAEYDAFCDEMILRCYGAYDAVKSMKLS